MQTKGQKFDTDKLRMDLIPSIVIKTLSNILTYGAKKYDPNNWKKGIEHSRLFAACLRHLYAYKSGESIDPESGLSHLGHALCNISFLIWMAENKPELNDLQETTTKAKPDLPAVHVLDAGKQDEPWLA